MQYENVPSASREEVPGNYLSNASDALPKHLDVTESTESGGGKPTRGSTYCLRPRTACRKTWELGWCNGLICTSSRVSLWFATALLSIGARCWVTITCTDSLWHGMTNGLERSGNLRTSGGLTLLKHPNDCSSVNRTCSWSLRTWIRQTWLHPKQSLLLK